MKAVTLSISIPYKGCDKNCPYCVSRMTGYIQSNVSLMVNNIEKVKTVARAAGVTCVSITSKGEPMLSESDLSYVVQSFAEYPIEIQTNGYKLAGMCSNGVFDSWIEENKAINTIAVSIDNWVQFEMFKDLWKECRAHNMLRRVTVNVLDKETFGCDYNMRDIIDACNKYHINQLTFRQITEPEMGLNDDQSKKTREWIQEHADKKRYEFIQVCIRNMGTKIRELPYGASVYDIKGVSVTSMDFCMQEFNTGEDVRSLIFQENGHLYDSWSTKASMIF